MKHFDELFIQETQPKSFKEVIYWWGGRRLAYNIGVGGCGVASIVLCWLFGFELDWMFVCFAALSYGIVANILYTSGWIAEGFLRRANQFDTKFGFIGPIWFAFGLIVSMVFTFFLGLAAGYFGFLCFPYIHS